MLARLALVLALVSVSGCGAGGVPDDAAFCGEAGCIDAFTPPVDASCGDACVDAYRMPGTGSCQPNAHGGRDCVGGPCSYDCCTADGHLSTCSIMQGSECAFVHPIDCGGGLCVSVGSCPDAGM